VRFGMWGGPPTWNETGAGPFGGCETLRRFFRSATVPARTRVEIEPSSVRTPPMGGRRAARGERVSREARQTEAPEILAEMRSAACRAPPNRLSAHGCGSPESGFLPELSRSIQGQIIAPSVSATPPLAEWSRPRVVERRLAARETFRALRRIPTSFHNSRRRPFFSPDPLVENRRSFVSKGLGRPRERARRPPCRIRGPWIRAPVRSECPVPHRGAVASPPDTV